MSSRPYIRVEQVVADLEPLVQACTYTFQDLLDLTGYTAPQIRHAWSVIKHTHGSNSTVGVRVVNDPTNGIKHIYMMTPDHAPANDILDNRMEDLMHRIDTVYDAIWNPMAGSRFISARLLRNLENVKDEFAEISERTKVASRRSLRRNAASNGAATP